VLIDSEVYNVVIIDINDWRGNQGGIPEEEGRNLGGRSMIDP
jgi:hypothetical protein